VRLHRGVVLLEVVTALALVAIAAVVLLRAELASTQAVARAFALEADIVAADRLLSAASLWPADELDQHMGERIQGRWSMVIQRLEPTLYSISLFDRTTRTLVLSTVVLRGTGE
jgi:hypothetical protein